MSGVGCGCDASLYLVKMKDADRFGPNYCDIQGVGGSAPCAEIDLFEGNRQAIASTVHMTQGTGADGTCNQDGCTEKWGEHETNTRGELVSELYGPGGNIDTTTLSRVIERGLSADGRLVRLDVAVSDRPGGIAELTKELADLGASVKDIFHERAWLQETVSSVYIRVILETMGPDHNKQILAAIRESHGTEVKMDTDAAL